MPTSPFTTITADGFCLKGYREVVSQSRGTVVLCHGISGDSSEKGLFDDFAAAAARQSITTVRFDFRAHGESSGEPRDLTLAGELTDLQSVVAQEVEDSQPVICIGTSFGCYAASHYVAGSPKAVGLVLWNPVLAYKKTFFEPNNAWASAIIESRQHALPPGIEAQLPNSPFVISTELATEFDREDTIATIKGLRVPILLFHGTDDTKVPFEISEEVAGELASIDFRPVEGAAHGFDGHRNLLIEQSLRWIGQLLG